MIADAEKYYALIKRGELAFGADNVEAVKAAWAESIWWDQIFAAAGLEDLPDEPESPDKYTEVLGDWLVRAYVVRGAFDSFEARRRLEVAKRLIVEDYVNQELEDEESDICRGPISDSGGGGPTRGVQPARLWASVLRVAVLAQ
jgi:hypothetical protein